MEEKTYDNATHLLSCRHVQGSYSCDYTMRCHVLKNMPNSNRVKILVFGNRFWAGKQHISRIRYVNRTRLTLRALDAENHLRQ